MVVITESIALISERYTSAIEVNNIAGVVTKAAQNSALLAPM